MNTEFIRSFIWQLKIITVVVGAIDLGLTSSRHVYILDEKAEFFLAMVIICFMISLIWILFALMDSLTENELLSKVDFIYHILGGVLLIISGICWFVFTAQGCKTKQACGRSGIYVQRIMAGIFGFFNGFLYLFVAFRLFRSSGSPNPA